MKKSWLYVAALVMSLSLYQTAAAQIRKIPAAVTEAFREKYPEAGQVEWKDKVTSFVAVFRIADVEYEARFNKRGQWKDTEHAIDATELPEAIQQGYDKSKYAEEWKIDGAWLIELPDDKVQYRLLARKSDLQKKNLLFSSNGRLLKDNVTL